MSATVPDSIRELAAGYALGALTPEETREFEAALARSPELAREVVEYREVNGLLALAEGKGARPDPALRARLLERIGTAKVAPLSPGRSNRSRWLGLGLAAAVLLSGGLALQLDRLKGVLKGREDELANVSRQLARREETLNTILAAQAELTVVQLTATGANPPGLQFFWNKKANTAVAHAFRLPPAAQGKVYQLWMIQNGKPLPGPTFSPESDGQALVLTFPLPAGGMQAAAVTLEPTGGSTTPTLPILLIGQVTG